MRDATRAEWLIQDGRTGQFWGPNSGGYFGLWGAGLYTEADARRLARNPDRLDKVQHISEYRDQIANMRGPFERLSAVLNPPLAPPPLSSGWQPIESAPKNVFVLRYGLNTYAGIGKPTHTHWIGDGTEPWHWLRATHWMPLPPAPPAGETNK